MRIPWSTVDEQFQTTKVIVFPRCLEEAVPRLPEALA